MIGQYGIQTEKVAVLELTCTLILVSRHVDGAGFLAVARPEEEYVE